MPGLVPGIHGHTRRVCRPGIGATPEIDIWRATRLTLKRYGEPAPDEGTARVEALARAGEDNGAAAWPDHGRGHPARQYELPPGQLHSPA